MNNSTFTFTVLKLILLSLLQNVNGAGTDWYDLISEDNLDLPNVNNLLEILQNKKQKLEAVC